MIVRELAGQRFGRLVVEERAGTTRHKKRLWRCRCDCGQHLEVTTGDLTSGHTVSCGCAKKDRVKGWVGEAHPNWTPDEAVTYQRQHARLRYRRGPASEHPCADCPGPARDWSYQGGCPDERPDDQGRPYCHHLDHYEPRCMPCHRAHDREDSRAS